VARSVTLNKHYKQPSPLPTTHFPLIGVTHNYSIKRLIGLDAILATTNDLRAKVIEAGQPEDKVFKLPNMVRIVGSGQWAVGSDTQTNGLNNESPLTTHHSPLTIGTMGRFVKKKGFDVFIRAMADLKAGGLNFRAVIGGGGEEEENLKKLAKELGLYQNPQLKENDPALIPDSKALDSSLNFIGWVEDKAKFFNDIDIFCLPSLHEPFGIILLEAFAYKKPVVAADSEGPSEIISDKEDALLVPKGDSKAMAHAIMQLAGNPDLAKKISQNAFVKAGNYDINHFAESLCSTLGKILENKHISKKYRSHRE
jgi:glycosyltransferase involved in cell wall biosynthesis